MTHAGRLLLGFIANPLDPELAVAMAEQLQTALDGVDVHVAIGLPATAEGRRIQRDFELIEALAHLDLDTAARPGRRRTRLDIEVAALLAAVKDFYRRLPTWQRHGGPLPGAAPHVWHLWRAHQWAPIPSTRQAIKALLARM